jgi:glycerol transport system ATP-binding protein
MTIRLEHVAKVIDGAMHVDGIDLTLEPGRLHVVLGRTQAGKTSLLRLIAGLDHPTTGCVLVGGQDARGIPVNKRRVAFVYQQFINYPSLTVQDNIAAPLRRVGAPRAEIARRVLETAKLLRIDHLLDCLPEALSGGQQQRVAIARALVKDAEVLLLDEPLVNLDYKLREELRAELKNIFKRTGRVVVYTTTEPVEALQMGGLTIVMDEGRILQVGPAAETYEAPASLKVAEVFSEPPMNLAPARLAGGELRFAGIALARPRHMARLPEGECVVGLRPCDLHLAPGAATLRGRVTLAEVNGSETFVHVATAGGHWVAEREGVHPMHNGAELPLGLDPARLYLFAARSGELLARPGGPA